MTDNIKKLTEKYKKSKRYCKGKLYAIKNWDKFDQWFDEVERLEEKWLKSEAHYLNEYQYVWISNEVYKGSCSLNRENLILLK